MGFTGYAYVGYPAIVWLLAKARRRPSFPDSTPRVTMIVAAYNEEDVIAEKLRNTLALDYPRELLQVIVAADGSTDGTVAIVEGFAGEGVELSYDPARGGKVAAIDRAMPRVRGEIVVISDANNAYEAGALRALVAPFADPSVGVTTGAKNILTEDGVLAESEGLYWKYESVLKEQETRLGTTVAVAGEMLALRTTLYEQPPQTLVIDDFYIAMRTLARGHRIVYVPAARCFERVSASAQAEVERRTRNLAGRLQIFSMGRNALPLRRPVVMWQVISHKMTRPLVPIAMGVAAVSHLAAATRPRSTGGWLDLPRRTARLLLVPHVGFYLAALLGARLERNTKVGRALYVATFLVNSNIAALRGIGRFLRGGQRPDWKRVERLPGAIRPSEEESMQSQATPPATDA